MAKKAAKKSTRSRKTPARVEKEILRTGQEIQAALKQRTTGIFHKHWWQDQMIRRGMSDESTRLQFLRFLDVLPALHSHEAVSGHLEMYYREICNHLPGAIRLGLDLSTGNSVLSRALSYNARSNTRRIAKRFSAGDSGEQILRYLRERRRRRLGTVLSMPRGAVLSKRESQQYINAAVNLITMIGQATSHWADDTLIDIDVCGLLPQSHLVVRVSGLDHRFSVVDAVGTIERVSDGLRQILRQCIDAQVAVYLETESADQRAITLTVLQQVLMEEEFRDCDLCGVEIDASLAATAEEIETLGKWSAQRRIPLPVRLIEAGSPDQEQRQRQRRNEPTVTTTPTIGAAAARESLLQQILQQPGSFRPALVGQDLRAIAHAITLIEGSQLDPSAIEFHLDPVWSGHLPDVLVQRNCRVRMHASTGDPVTELSLMARHFLQNTSLTKQLIRNFLESASDETLPMKSSNDETEETLETEADEVSCPNEPRTDFSVEEKRKAMQESLDWVKDQFGASFPLIIDGKSSDSRSSILSRSPSDRNQIIGKVAAASTEQATEAIEAARRAFQPWAATETAVRLEYTELIAAEMRDRRFELAAWIVCENGRTWREADAEVADAIDLCHYHVHTMRELSSDSERQAAGEQLRVAWRPRGVCAVVSESNSPLAGITGAIAAALVTGNTVVLKPCEHSSVVAAKLVEITRNAGLPGGVVNYLPGNAEDLVETLVTHTETDVIVFSGSRERAFQINQLAAQPDKDRREVRRVIADAATSNTIIVDEDADLDQAIPGVVRSAFSCGGQHPSACSSVIVLKGIQQKFVARLQAAVQDLKMGPADDPSTEIGPLISEETVKRLQKRIRQLDSETDGNELVSIPVPRSLKNGTYFGPRVYSDVPADSILLRQRLSGPLLAVTTARQLDDAIQLANQHSPSHAVAVYSRNPESLRRVQTELTAGSLFLNRDLTETVIARHPTGGCRLAGTGASAGTPEWLQQFATPVAISEDISTRGFESKTRKKKKKKK